MSVQIAVVDYLGEELDPLISALYDLEDVDPVVTSEPETIAAVDGIILCGKSSFAQAITQMRLLSLDRVISESIVERKPFLAINVGLHVLYKTGMEVAPGRSKQAGEQVARGLNIRPGAVWDIKNRCGKDAVQPHVGFAPIRRDKRCETLLLDGLPEDDEYFFDHSFVAPTGPWVQAWTLPEGAEEEFPSVVDFGNTCFGIQFHPEESGEAGLRLLQNFAAIVDAG